MRTFNPFGGEEDDNRFERKTIYRLKKKAPQQLIAIAVILAILYTVISNSF